jgi:acyl-CoA reductase-like NAD-dependent aldehyde dehydrogenase
MTSAPPSCDVQADGTTLEDRCRRAQAAAVAWRQLGVAQRLRPVRGLRRLLVERTDYLCAAVGDDLGKPAVEVVGSELLPLAEACSFLQKEAVRLLRPRRVPGRLRPIWLWGQQDRIYRRPRGVVGIIGTWNYPLFLNGVHLAQALTAGNAVVWKPSELAPRSAAALAELIAAAGVPEDLLQRLPATRSAGAELVEAPVNHIVFTGSAETGRVVARRLGECLVSSTLELSGCDPQFVLADADVPLAARAAWFGATLNRGQTCVAVRRAFVQRPAYHRFCAELAALSAGAQPVRLAQASQVRHAAGLVADALACGARLLRDGMNPPSDGPECPAVVVVDAGADMALCRQASFAPLLAVIPFGDVDEAVQLAARCPYHLGASVFTARPRLAAALAAELGAGAVTVNDVVMPTAHPVTPFGGRGASGWGVTQGAEGLLEMTVPQVVSRRAGRWRPHFDLAPGQATPAAAAAQAELLGGLMEACHAGPRWRRAAGWWKVLRAGWRWWRSPRP